MKTKLTIAAGVALFAAGQWRYGIPPPGSGQAFESATAAAEVPSAPATSVVAGQRIVISQNNGAQEDNRERVAEQDLMRSIFERKFPDATIRNDTWQFSPDTF